MSDDPRFVLSADRRSTMVRRVEIGSPQRQHDEQKMAELTMLAALMLERADEITDTVMARVYERFPVYTGMVKRELLR
jgi:hypothetical protein